MDEYRELRLYLEQKSTWNKIERFIQWLNTQGIFLATYQKPLSDTINVSRVREMVRYKGDLENLLGDWGGINMEEVDRQKDLVLEEFFSGLNSDD